MQIPTTALPGTPYPMGATWTGDGVNFAIFTENAALVQLCLFDDRDREVNRINMRWNTRHVWHCFLPQARPGLRYGYRIHGPYNPEEGLHYNPSKLLLDPYAKGITDALIWHDTFNGFRTVIDRVSGNRQPTQQRDDRDNAAFMPKCLVVDPNFPWPAHDRPRHPLQDSIIYEIHVKGFSKLNPNVPPALRGTYAGLGHEASIAYLKSLGVTAVELLPVHLSLSEPRLIAMGLSNYWGYNSIGFFVPDPRYAATDNPVREFQQMVLSLHSAGIEVILDVVYNHTAEQGDFGPTLSFRGIDNPAYYRMEPNEPGRYLNFTGCGNSIDTREPKVLQLITDSLRYWVEYMHVDGFRFDLATTIARIDYDHHYSQHSSILDAIEQDPLLNTVKLIAEPWDCGAGGYQLGNFPANWSEWNDDWRDTVRRFWRGDPNLLGRIASKISGSSETYYHRSPLASLNFVTAHDGFTLADLVTYEQKYNQANGEDNRDGSSNNNNWNCGVEGPTANEEIRELRLRQQRNMLLTLMLSQGVPMLLGGDEFGRTQRGNNNAYCQDNAISYFDWDWSEDQQELLSFTKRLIEFRRQHPAFRRTTFFRGEVQYNGIKDVVWLNGEGQAMSEADWHGCSSCLGMYIAGDYLEGAVDERGLPQRDQSFLILLNNGDHPVECVLPHMKTWTEWRIVFDTAMPYQEDVLVQDSICLGAHAAIVLQECPRSGKVAHSKSV